MTPQLNVSGMKTLQFPTDAKRSSFYLFTLLQLGICSGSNDGGRPIANLDAFYQHPERHCVWYGRLHVDK